MVIQISQVRGIRIGSSTATITNLVKRSTSLGIKIHRKGNGHLKIAYPFVKYPSVRLQVWEFII